jgi:dihydrolipoamide dehydrogenase
MAETYDVAIIGAGPGGYVAAIRAGQLGLKTVIVEDRFLGGVCLNIGCIPSKAVITAGKDFQHAVHGGDKGIVVSSPKVDMKRLVAYKDGVVKKLTSGVGGLLKGNHVEVRMGRATLTAKDTVKIEGKDAGTVKAKHIILATGSSTIEIPGFAFDEKRIVSSTGALDLQAVPEHLVIIGGGVIGLELGCAYHNLGTKQVTVIEMMDQLVPGVDRDMAKGLERILTKRGWKIHLGARAREAKLASGARGVKVTFEAGGRPEALDASVCLVSVGRRPNTKDIGLDKAGVKTDERGFVPTDAQGRTNVPTIFAIGDITHGPMLAHKASKEGIVAAETIRGSKGAAKDWVTIPGVIFTDPEIATAGLTEDEAKKKGDVKVGRFQVAGLGKALADNETDGFYKLIADAKTDKLLGVHILAAHASDLITEAVLAMELGATAEDLALTVHPHPTMSEGLMEAAEALHGQAIHALNR